ncbi:DUF3043 domain-containing protein [Buchananella felis]|uniref:DUF3043 domain-containing protein n=1 Tax=Buchananella felis TaxID=3231492 RepID=UPI003527C48B
MVKSKNAHEPAADSPKPVGKGRPTPKRREQEARNRRPLVPKDRKAAKAASKQARREIYARQQEALLSGDERYLPVRDKGPVRRYVRDFVDARWCLGEFSLPLMLILMVAMLVLGNSNPNMAVSILGAIYGIFVFALLDSIIVGIQAGRRVLKKFGPEKKQRVFFYAFSRSFLLRPLRSPRPQVGRGEFPS